MPNLKPGRRVRQFHQARWDEPVVLELSRPGERGVLVPAAEPDVAAGAGPVESLLPAAMLRSAAPELPEISQPRVLRHYLRLSQETLGADLNVEIGQGTCTMKYSPKVNQFLIRSQKLMDLHPSQPAESMQGLLELTHRLVQVLRQLSGMDEFSLQPGSGTQALYAMASIVRLYHRVHGEEAERTDVITTAFSHPSESATAAVKGFRVITLTPGANGLPSLDELRRVASAHTAALVVANPEDTGLFNPEIAEMTAIVHKAGGLCYYDQANANGLLGITRAREAGFDMCFFNLHKTFAAPHGSGGPAAGALGVTERLAAYLPVPVVRREGATYLLDYGLRHTIGKVRSFQGVPQAFVHALAWVMSLGAEGLREVARTAVLNSNYVASRVAHIPGLTVPFDDTRRLEQVRYSWQDLLAETGVGSEDIGRRMADFGLHYWTSHHPFVVPEPCTLEPTESYSKDDLDEYIAALEFIAEEAGRDPDAVLGAPRRSVVHRSHADEWFEQPDRWAITWRAFKRKHPSRDGVGPQSPPAPGP